MKWGIIGSGKIARRFASDLPNTDGAVLGGVFSQNPENAKRFAGEFNTSACRSLAELFERSDGIYVATPHSSHKAHTLAAIAAAKPVLCEKPFAVNAAEAREVFGCAEKHGVFVMEAMWTRFFPAFQRILKIVRSGEIGELVSVESSFGYEMAFDPSSRVFDLDLGGGSLLDVGVYSVSLAHMLCPEKPVRIRSEAEMAATGADQSASWEMEFSSGIWVRGSSSVVRKLANEAVITGTKAVLRIPEFWRAKEFFFNDDRCTYDFAGGGFQFEANEVMECVRRSKPQSELMPWSQTLNVMESMDEIRRQIGLVYPSDQR